MAYYLGDYYEGDYYQGDPFLGALIGGGISWLTKKIFKRKLSIQAQKTVGQRMTRGMVRRGAPLAAGAAIASGLSIPIPFTPFKVTPRAAFPGGAPLFSPRGPAEAPPMMAPAGACPSGYHLAKDGSGRLVRNRSMNVANPRALRRSLRRVAGFGKLAQRSKKDIRRAAKAIGA